MIATAAIAYACGPRGHASESPARQNTTQATEQGVQGDLKISVQEEVVFDLRVTNGDDRHVELRFPNGQTHDFVVQDTLGREIWKWSEGRMFTQAMQSRVLDRNESISYTTAWDPGSLSGTYVAVVSLRSENHPLEERTRFELPAR